MDTDTPSSLAKHYQVLGIALTTDAVEGSGCQTLRNANCDRSQFIKGWIEVIVHPNCLKKSHRSARRSQALLWSTAFLLPMRDAASSSAVASRGVRRFFHNCCTIHILALQTCSVGVMIAAHVRLATHCPWGSRVRGNHISYDTVV